MEAEPGKVFGVDHQSLGRVHITGAKAGLLCIHKTRMSVLIMLTDTRALNHASTGIFRKKT